MIIAIPKEIKSQEYRVGGTPQTVGAYVRQGHQVLIQKGAGEGVGHLDADYVRMGAEIVETAQEIFERGELIVKVKEPQLEECQQLREGQLLFTYLHLAPDEKQTAALLESGCTAIAYETVTDAKGTLPLLAPMSEVAGRLSIQAGAYALEKEQGGLGVLLGGVPGTAPARVLVIGGGVSGYNAARMAVGLGADVTILERSLDRIRTLEALFEGRVKVRYALDEVLVEELKEADLVIGAVLLPGAKAPKLITREHLKIMKKGSVIVDISIDQGGILETSRPTTHQNPTFVEEGVVHYCVANMPGAVAKTSTEALTNATFPFVISLANKGWLEALKEDSHLRAGLNVHNGQVFSEAVAQARQRPYVSFETLV